jgi:integrase
MAKVRSGYVHVDKAGRCYARVTFTDLSGRRRNIKRRADNRTAAKAIINQIIRELDDYGEKTVLSAHKTFNELADYYAKTYLIPPQYVNERKVAGMRSYKDGLLYLRSLRAYFGHRHLRSITHGDLEKYKVERLATTTVHGNPRSIAFVNRELSSMRRIMNVALREGWILRSPFQAGDKIISLADEHKRERILTNDEEKSLLAACNGKRSHLRPILICALDTGMRQGEILSLRWKDISFDEKILTVRAFNTKTMTAREVAMTTRLERELWQLYKAARSRDALVFGIEDNVKKSFNSARKQAGLPDVRFHDLRHTAATRLVGQHLPLAEVGRVLGHTQPVTTYRYVNANIETARRAAMALDAFHAEANFEFDSETIN